MRINVIDFKVNQNKIKQSDLNIIMNMVQDRKIPKRKFFCRVYHDLHYLIEFHEEDYPSSKSPIDEIQAFYEKIYWRHFYYFLYSFIFYNYTYEKYLEVKQSFRADFEENEIDEEVDVLEEDTDYPLFRKIYPHLAMFKSLIDAYTFYEKLLEDNTLFNQIEDLKLLERRVDIRKHDISINGEIVMMYLTYGRNSAKSHASRVRNFQTKALKQQEQSKNFSNYLAKLILDDYYRKKYYNSRLRIDDFLETQDIGKISRRTFFSFQNVKLS